MGLFPVGWLLVSYARNGGGLEANLPPGFGTDSLLGILIVGVATAFNAVAFGYLEYLGLATRE